MKKLWVLLVIVFMSSACATIPKEGGLTQGDHFVANNGVRLHYLVAGNGPVLVAVSGGPGFDASYLKMPEMEKHFKVVYLDPVGTGKSDALQNPKEYTYQRNADDIERLRLHLGLEKIFLLGHSAGGMYAQLYALDHPTNLAGLILYSTYPVINKEWMDDLFADLKKSEGKPWYPEAIAAFTTALDSKSDEEVTAKYKKALGFYFYDYAGRKEKIDQAFAGLVVHINPLRTGFLQENAKFDVRDRLKEIKTNVLVLVGRYDGPGGLKYSEMFKNGILASKVVVLENGGHFGHFEEPEAFTKAVLDFYRTSVEKR
jgi:proline-specific peptidase